MHLSIRSTYHTNYAYYSMRCFSPILIALAASVFVDHGGAQSAGSQPGTSSQPGQTVVTGTVGSLTITEIFVPTTISALVSLASTITSITTDAQSRIETLVIGPGGVVWTPLSQASSGVAQLNPPITPPGNTNTASLTQARSSPTTTSALNTGSITTSAAAQSSASGAFDDPNQSETTIIIGGTTLHYSKETIESLSTITAPTTITTPM